jgi:hypothetical protein
MFPIYQEEKSYSPSDKEISYTRRMTKLDPVRKLFLDRLHATSGASLKSWSNAIGKNDAYLHQFLNRGTPVELPEKVRQKLAALMGVHEDSLRHVEDHRRVEIGQEFDPDPSPDRISVEEDRPFPDAIAQMVGRIGGGSTGAVITIDVGEMQSREEVGEWWRIPPAVLRGLARSDIASTVGFAMDGDSMEPTIQRTDIVFIDTKRQKIEPDGIWAVDYGLGRTLKRVWVERADGQIRFILKSDNKAYPDQAFSPDEVTVFGRYVGRFSVF